MKNRIELDGSVCRIAGNGNLSVAPSSRELIYLALIEAGLLGFWLWGKGLGPIAAALLLVSPVIVLIRRANQPGVQIIPASGRIEWRRGFKRCGCPFGNVLGVNVFLDRREYAWSTHLVDRRKNVVELHARLELVMKEDGPLFLGGLSGENAEERAFLLAQSIAKTIGVSVSSTGYASKYG